MTKTDMAVFMNYMNMRTARIFKVNIGDEITPDWKTVVADDSYRTAESFLKEGGLIIDSFAPPRVSGAGQVYPTLISSVLNPGTETPIVYEDYVTTDLTVTDFSDINTFENWATDPVSPEDEKLTVTSNMLRQQGFGFRKYYPSRLVDADLDGPFGLDTEGVSINSYVQTAFSSTQYVTTVSVWMSAANYDGEFQIKGSNNGADWTNLGTVFKPTLSGVNSKTFTNLVGYRYYRLVLTKAPVLHPEVKVYEMAFYAKAQFMYEVTDDNIGEKEGDSSIAFFTSRAVSEGSEVVATYTPTAPLDISGNDLLYLWVKANTMSTVAFISIVGTDGVNPVTVEGVITPSVENEWCRVWFNVGAFLNTGLIESIEITPRGVKGNKFYIGALRIGESYVVSTGGYPHGESYLPFESDNTYAYLFITSSGAEADVLASTRFTTMASGDGVPNVIGLFSGMERVGILTDADEPLSVTNLYMIKFLYQDSFDGDYYWWFEVPTANDDGVAFESKVVGFAVANSDLFE